MKRIVFVVVALIMPLSGCDFLGLSFSPSPEGKKPLSIEEKYNITLQWANELYSENLISVSPSTFANIAFIVMYAESGLDTKAVGYDKYNSQGINQLTEQTRLYIGAPKNILNKSFKEQLGYFKLFLIKTGKLKRIQNAAQLHALNFRPANIHKPVLADGKKAPHLDKNKDGVITLRDFELFHIERIQKDSNQFMLSLYKKINV